MNFETSLCFSIFSVCIGGILGSVCCILFSRVFKRSRRKAYWTVFFIFLSACVADAALGLIFIDTLHLRVHLLFEFRLFFLLLFLAGFLCTVLWKIFLPLAVFFYIAVSAVCGVSLYRKFPVSSGTVSLSVYQNRITLEDKSVFVDSPENKNVVIEVFTLPPTLLVPLPRLWYSAIGIVDLNENYSQNQDIRGFSGFTGFEKSGGSISSQDAERSFFRRKVDEFVAWSLGSKEYLFIPIPNQEILPVMYNLNFTQKGEILNCSLNKIL